MAMTGVPRTWIRLVGVMRPDKQRQSEPRHPRRAHAVNGDDKVQTGQDRRETGDEDAQRGRNHAGVRGRGAVRRVEGPPVSTPPVTSA